MNQATMHALADRFLGAWNSQEVPRVLDCYTDDLVYRDPNTRGDVRGREAMAHYLQRLFGDWTMTWALREGHRGEDGDTCAILWHATFRRAAGGPTVAGDGMDLVVVRGDKIARNEVYFDRTLLAPLMPDAERAALKSLLLKGWMTHDAMWFKTALDELGIEQTNALNRGAIRAMAPVEVRRLLRALGMSGVTSYPELRRFLEGALALVTDSFMAFDFAWEPPDALTIRVGRCFAHDGVARLGAIERYECGIMERIYGWLDALDVPYRATPPLGRCTLHHEGYCRPHLAFDFDQPKARATAAE